MKAPRGTRDFGPEEMALRRHVEARMRDVLRRFHFREVQTPTFENLELFLAKSGEGIRDELYAFQDKSQRELCLRPELTAPVMRFYYASLTREPKPLRLYYIGPCFRYDRPQAGRYREFWQVGVEVIGDQTPHGHAELLWMALQLFDAVGLRNLVLRVGHLGLLRGLLESVARVPVTEQGPLMRLIDKKDVEGLRTALAERGGDAEAFLRLFDVHDLAGLADLDLPPSARDGMAHLDAVLAALRGFGADMDRVRFDPTIARGLEYYSGLVFELDCPDLGAEKQLLGGGDYDLSGVFGANPEPTVGFALGFDRTLVALERTGTLPAVEDRLDAYVAALGDGAVDAARRVATRLRAEGASVELDVSGRGPKKALQRADAHKARKVVLVGERELERGVVAVKDLATGAQSDVPLDDVAAVARA